MEGGRGEGVVPNRFIEFPWSAEGRASEPERRSHLYLSSCTHVRLLHDRCYTRFRVSTRESSIVARLAGSKEKDFILFS